MWRAEILRTLSVGRVSFTLPHIGASSLKVQLGFIRQSHRSRTLQRLGGSKKRPKMGQTWPNYYQGLPPPETNRFPAQKYSVHVLLRKEHPSNGHFTEHHWPTLSFISHFANVAIYSWELYLHSCYSPARTCSMPRFLESKKQTIWTCPNRAHTLTLMAKNLQMKISHVSNSLWTMYI